MGNKDSKKTVRKNELSEEEINVILNNTTYTREAVLEFYENQFIKLFPSGFLYKNQFTKLYKSLYPEKKCDEFVDTLFALFDFDRSGTITFSEFLIAISLSGNKEPAEKLKLVFRMYDYNRNGLIEKEEVERILTSVANVSDEIDYETVMHWDTNNKGSLTEDEFVNFVMNNPKLKKYFLDLVRIHDS